MFTYLLLNLLTIAVPLSRSFEHRIAYYKKFRSLFIAIFISGILFLTWDYFFTKAGIWSFNSNYLVGITLAGLPLEEWLFFITVPFACVFIHEVLKHFVPDYFKGKGSTIAIVTGIFLLVTGFLNINLSYTAVTFIAAGSLLVVLGLARVAFLSRFWLTYFVHLIPFFIINGVLTALPVVRYNNSENLGIRIGTIPIEDTVYSMLLLLTVIGIYEYFNQKIQTPART